MTAKSKKINISGLAGFSPNARPITWKDVAGYPTQDWPTGKYIVCPKMAAALLQMNQHNRNISQAHVDSLVHQIKLGEWAFQGSSIVIFFNGILGDGQHRLEGVVKTGISIETMIVTGVDPRKFTKIDTIHRLRTKATALENYPNVVYPGPTSYAAAWVWNYAMGPQVLSGSNRLLAANNERIYLTVENHPDLITMTNEIYHLKGAKSLFPPALISVGYMASMVDPDKAHDFVSGMITGAMLGVSDPRLRMREILSNSLRRSADLTGPKKSRAGVSSTMLSLEKFNSMILAWNAFYEGKTPASGRLTWTTSSGKSSVYPTISGLDRTKIFPADVLDILIDATDDTSATVDTAELNDQIAA